MGKLRYQRRVKAAPAVAGIATPANSVLPVITGDVAGETSTTSDGTWSNAAAFKYQWYLDGVAIAGETTNSIDTDEGWVDQTLSVVVSGCNGAGCVEATSLGVVLTEGSAYTGPLDLVPGVVGVGSRALSAAWLGENIFRLIRDSDDAELDFAADAVDGTPPSTAIDAWIGAPFNKTGAVVETQDTIVLTNATNVYVGALITGTDIPAGTTVTDITDLTITISQVATGTNPAETLTFTPRGLLKVLYGQTASGLASGNFSSYNSSVAWWDSTVCNGRGGFTVTVGLGQGNYRCADFTFGPIVNSSNALLAYRAEAEIALNNGDGSNYLDFSPSSGGFYTLWSSDGDNQAYADFEITLSDSAFILVTGRLDIGSGAVLENGNSVALTLDDQGGPIGSVSFDGLNALTISGEFGEGIITNSAGSITSASQNIATYYGITL